jgi:flagellin
MSIVVNTNIASMNAQRSLMNSSNALQEAMERLSTGKKINSAADDAAGFAIAESMTAQIRGLTMATKNASDALGLLRVVENATNDVTDMLQRIRSLAVQAQSDTNSSSDKEYLQKEAEALFKEIDRVSTDTSYNNVAYLGTGAASVNVQVGYNDGNTISITTYNITSGNLGTKDTAADVAAVAGVDNSSPADGDFDDAGDVAPVAGVDNNGDGDFDDAAVTGTKLYKSGGTAAEGFNATTGYLDISLSGSLKVITDAIDQVAGYKAEWGAGQNRLEYTVSNLMNVVEFTSAARSRIQDADFAVEAAKLAKAQVLQQSGAAMLAQANAAPQLALQLLK